MTSEEFDKIDELERKFDAFRVTIYRSLAGGAILFLGSALAAGIAIGSYISRLDDVEKTQVELVALTRALSETTTRHNEQILRGISVDAQREGLGTRVAVVESAIIRMERNIDWLVAEYRKSQRERASD